MPSNFKNYPPTSFEDWNNRFDPKNPEWITDCKILKSFTNKNNITIAGMQIQDGWIPTEIKHLVLPANSRFKKFTVAHYLCMTVFHREESEKQIIFNISKKPELLKLKDTTGKIPLHHAVVEGLTVTEPHLLKIKDDKGSSIAHTQARLGWIPTCKEVSNLKNNDGVTVIEAAIRMAIIKYPQLITKKVIKENLPIFHEWYKNNTLTCNFIYKKIQKELI